MQALPVWFDVAVMSLNCMFGAALARSRDTPIYGTLFVGLVVGLGGGMVRDALLGLEASTISGWAYIPCGLIGAVVGGFLFARIVTMPRPLILTQGITMGLLVTIGAQKALQYDTPVFSAVALGVITASFGAVLADTITGHRAIVVRQAHWLASSLLCGSVVFVTLSLLIGFWVAVIVSVLVTATLRYVSEVRDWPSPYWPRQEHSDA